MRYRGCEWTRSMPVEVYHLFHRIKDARIPYHFKEQRACVVGGQAYEVNSWRSGMRVSDSLCAGVGLQVVRESVGVSHG